MSHRIEVVSTIKDTRAEQKKQKIVSNGMNASQVQVSDVYTLNDSVVLNDLGGVAEMVTNPVTEHAFVNSSPRLDFDYAVEIGFKPGVTDNVGHTVREGLEDRFGLQTDEQQVVASSQMIYLSGVTEEDAKNAGELFANPLIQNIRVKSRGDFEKDGGMQTSFPQVVLDDVPEASVVSIINATDDELIAIGKKGIANPDGTRRGPLAQDLDGMKAIQSYFSGEGRDPYDIEVEAIAQTWSEHCRHPKFANPIDEFQDGLFKTFIKGATERIRRDKKELGLEDICVSVFTDNAGVITFDENNNICLKVESHNAPSALDPFGGSATGIVGVNRDPMGTGIGSKPFLNISGPFCFGDPEDTRALYKGDNFTQRMLLPRQILDGVFSGVNYGGNCSGIPTSHLELVFDDRFRGKPIVPVGTFGVMPKTINGKPSHEKQASPGEYIVMVGGRVGKDGIHGATFSSEALDSGSPVTAVQIANAITQKKMSDAGLEARDAGLYSSITDDGAGGLSCSVAEMGKESGGCHAQLDRVPLKYPGMRPDEIWISEAQERMTLSVPKDKWSKYNELMKSRGVEATVIGEFTDSGRCIVEYKGKRVMDVDMNFLHNGFPVKQQTTTFTRKTYDEPDFPVQDDMTKDFLSMLGRRNIASLEFITNQFDHEVQGGSVLKPLQGRGRVNADATITRPILDLKKGVVLSQAVYPRYSDIDTYNMAAAAIDSAVRKAISVGGNLNHLALVDNFFWCSGDEPERLGQLLRACKACYDYSVVYETPFVSGKDSMFNDFKGFDENGKPLKISIPPMVLITAASVMDDVRKAVSLDAKMPGDLVYVLGDTKEELGGSEYFAMKGEELRGRGFIGNNVPTVNASENKIMYNNFSREVDRGLLSSAVSVGKGGLAVALARTAMGGMFGMQTDLSGVPIDNDFGMRPDYTLYSESQGRLIATVAPSGKNEFEDIMQGNCVQIGEVRGDNRFIADGFSGQRSKQIINTTVDKMLESYKSTFKDY